MSKSSATASSAGENPVPAWNEFLFRREHGIADEVWRARGYARYGAGRAGVEDLRRIDANYCRVPDNDLRRRTQHAGLAIPRRALPDTVGPTPIAELRPDDPICMSERWHAHPGGNREHEHDWDNPHLPGRKSDPEAHQHCDWAKYLFVKGEPIESVSLRADVKARDLPFFELYEEQTKLEEALSDRIGGDVQGSWDRGVLEELLGFQLPERPGSRGRRQTGDDTLISLGVVEIDVGSGTSPFEAHSVLRKARESETTRIDANPLALGLLMHAERIYFGIEGCIKADAMLSAILESGDRATVVSVPSVTLWPKDAGYYDGDLRTLARLAADREVAIVVDSDWDDFDKNKGGRGARASRVAHGPPATHRGSTPSDRPTDGRAPPVHPPQHRTGGQARGGRLHRRWGESGGLEGGRSGQHGPPTRRAEEHLQEWELRESSPRAPRARTSHESPDRRGQSDERAASRCDGGVDEAASNGGGAALLSGG
jgi:hypothetical protein